MLLLVQHYCSLGQSKVTDVVGEEEDAEQLAGAPRSHVEEGVLLQVTLLVAILVFFECLLVLWLLILLGVLLQDEFCAAEVHLVACEVGDLLCDLHILIHFPLYFVSRVALPPHEANHVRNH